MAIIRAFIISVIALLTLRYQTHAVYTNHECHMVIKEYKFISDIDKSDTSKNILPEINITSDVLNATFDKLNSVDHLLVPNDIPVFYYEQKKRKKTNFNTNGLHYYESQNQKGCQITVRIHSSNDSDAPVKSIGGRIICYGNTSYEFTDPSEISYINNVLHIKLNIKAFKRNVKEIKSYKDVEVENFPNLVDLFKTFVTPEKQNNERRRRDVSHTKYVEMAIVIDHGTYTHFHHDSHQASTAIIDIINYVDTIFRKYNVRIILSTIEIWNKEDLSQITSSAEDTLLKFSEFATKAFVDFDNVHLITTKEFDHHLAGLGYIGAMCSKTHSTGVTTFKQNAELSVMAGTVTHELGHNFNMVHDDTLSSCKCEDTQGVCLMHSQQSAPVPKYFSTCSQESMEKFLNKPKSGCLDNKPDLFSISTETCGNNKIDPGEECDCGSSSFCTNPCCDAETCKLTPESECAHGECCFECKVLPSNTVCREAGVNECDAIDYCNGINGTCSNVYVADGTSCNIDGICYEGACKSRNHQCNTMWGGNAGSSDKKCYDFVNAYGEMYGHCGVIDAAEGKYKKCAPEDVLCGTLHCTNVSVLYPIVGFKSQHSVVRLRDDGLDETCYGGSADMGKESLNPGYVYDHTPCGENKYCINSTCVPLEITPKCQYECHPNGVCSNIGTCQCYNGWSGDKCTVQVEILPTIPPNVVKYYEKSAAVPTMFFIGHFECGIWYFLIGACAVLHINLMMKM